MIGVSLPLTMLCEYAQSKEQDEILTFFGSTGKLLDGLKSLGVTHIELRNLAVNDSFRLVPDAIRSVKDAGLELTIHSVADDMIYPEQFCDYYSMFVHKATFVLHSINKYDTLSQNRSATAKILRYYADEAARRKLDYKIALENNRMKTKTSFVGECHEVEKTYLLAVRKNTGLCFDMGHRLSDVRSFLTDESIMPSERFMKNVIHTHIHYFTEDKRTHGPLVGECPEIKEYIDKLKSVGYSGIYNLELDPNRFGYYINPSKALIESIENLVNMIG